MPVVKAVTMYKDQLCSRCGFKIPKGDKAYDVGEKIVCSVCFLILRRKR